MSPLVRGLLLALLHVLLVASLGAKLLYDRATRPRVWARTAPVDPDLPFRGRYVQLRLIVEGKDLAVGDERRADVALRVEGDQLIASRAEHTGIRVSSAWGRAQGAFVLDEPIAFFIPEHADDPSRRKPGEELWAEVTIPKRGPPRPIRLGVKKGGELTPLEF